MTSDASFRRIDVLLAYRLMAAMKSRTSSIRRPRRLSDAAVFGLLFDRRGAVGDGEGADPARRTFQPMRQKQPLPDIGVDDLSRTESACCTNSAKHLLLEAAVAHRLAGQMGQIDRPRPGRSPTLRRPASRRRCRFRRIRII